MKPVQWNMTIGTMAFLAFLFLLCTGLVMQFSLPHGSPSRGMTVLSMDRHAWGSLHAWASWLFIGLIAAHLFLHWGWIKRMAMGAEQALAARKWAGRVSLLLLGLALFLALALPFALPIGQHQPWVEPQGHGDDGGWR